MAPPSPLRRHRSPAGVSERRRLREDGLVGSPADLGLEMHAKELATNPSTMSPYTRPPCPRAIHLSNHGKACAAALRPSEQAQGQAGSGRERRSRARVVPERGAGGLRRASEKWWARQGSNL